jgi:hypothetical protein
MRTQRIAIVLLGIAGLAAGAAEPKLSPTDLDRARTYLRQTEDLVVGATQGLSEAQWKYKAAPDRWSIAEVVEHIVLAQEYVLGTVRAELAKSAATEGMGNAAKLDGILKDKTPDRTVKFQAPPFLVPTGRWTPAESMERLHKNFAALRAWLETPGLREHSVAAPAVKALTDGAYESMDGYQTILFVAGHTQRHAMQAVEVRASAGFPAK